MTAKRAEKPNRETQWEIRSSGDWITHDLIQAALQDFDQAMHQAEKVWGVDRLPLLVAHETRLKWWKAMDALSAAIWNGDADQVKALTSNLVRGIDRLIEEATAAGHQPLDIDVWETPLSDGRKLRIVRTWPERAYRPDKEDGVLTYTLEEIGRLVGSYSLLGSVKNYWPAATVTAIDRNKEPNDDIPF